MTKTVTQSTIFASDLQQNLDNYLERAAIQAITLSSTNAPLSCLYRQASMLTLWLSVPGHYSIHNSKIFLVTVSPGTRRSRPSVWMSDEVSSPASSRYGPKT